MNFQKFFNETIINEWLFESKRAMDGLLKWSKKHKVFLSNKQMSENFSRLLESKGKTIFSKYYDGEVINAASDKEPDLLFDDNPLEIKVTNGHQWTGGEYSKRPCDYFLISRDELFSEFFVCLINLQKEDWISGGDNFYGTNYKKKQLMENKNKKILKGNMDYIYTKKNKIRGIKLLREGF